MERERLFKMKEIYQNKLNRFMKKEANRFDETTEPNPEISQLQILLDQTHRDIAKLFVEESSIELLTLLRTQKANSGSDLSVQKIDPYEFILQTENLVFHSLSDKTF